MCVGKSPGERTETEGRVNWSTGPIIVSVQERGETKQQVRVRETAWRSSLGQGRDHNML